MVEQFKWMTVVNQNAYNTLSKSQHPSSSLGVNMNIHEEMQQLPLAVPVDIPAKIHSINAIYVLRGKITEN